MLFALMVLIGLFFLHQQSLNRRMSTVVGSLVGLSHQLERDVGEGAALTVLAGTAHERLLSAANAGRLSSQVCALVLLCGALLYAWLSQLSRWLRFGVVAWALFCVLAPIFSAVD
jgi:hypothetical protein